MVADGNSSQEYLVNAGVSQSSILGPTLFLLYINDLSDVICNVAIYIDDTIHCSKFDQASDKGNNWNLLLNLNLICNTLEKLYWLCLTGLITLVLLVWKWIGLCFRKNNFLRCWGCALKLDLCSYITPIAKIFCKKVGFLIRSMKFLSPDFVLDLYKSSIRPCMEYCCHVLASAPSHYLGLLDKLQNVGLLVLHLLPLVNPWLTVEM